jgi:hypothetical protein
MAENKVQDYTDDKTKDTLILAKPISSVKIKIRIWDVTWESM